MDLKKYEKQTSKQNSAVLTGSSIKCDEIVIKTLAGRRVEGGWTRAWREGEETVTRGRR